MGLTLVNAVYLDDMVSGFVVENNLIENVPTAVEIGGGRDKKYRGKYHDKLHLLDQGR